MAIVQKYAGSFRSPTAINSPPPVLAEGVDRTINTGAVAIANGDNATSKIYLGKIPSGGVPDLRSQLTHSAITGLTSLHVGVEYNGQTVNASIFASALNLTSAGSKNVFNAIAVADIGKRLWQLLGLAYDPGREYDIIATMNTDATAAGTIAAQIAYSK
jgi:hypothetical protein